MLGRRKNSVAERDRAEECTILDEFLTISIVAAP
jgi:hypothetical protein